MAKFKGNRCIPTAEGKWDKAKEYLGLSVVLDEKTGDSYTSKKVVPAGTELTNKDYWALSGQYNAQMALIKLQLEAMQNIPEGGTTADAALENIRIGADGTEYATPGDAVRGQVGALSEEIVDQKKILDDFKTPLSNIEPCKFNIVEENKVYSRSFINGTNLSGFSSSIKKVNVGETYLVSTYVIHNNDYSAVLFYNESTYVGSVGDYAEVGNEELIDYVFTIPSGVTKIIVVEEYYKPTLKSKAIVTTIPKFSNVVKVENEVVYIKAKYNDSYDICFVLKKRGGNNLVDFEQIFLVRNTDNLNKDFTSKRILLKNSTDFFSPHVVGANQNKDGDNINSYNFTGGNHKTTNTDVGGGTTAKCTSFKIYANNMEITNETETIECNEVKLLWTNLIQGYNTSKSDGSGRSILEEDIVITIKGTRIECDIKHVALESLKRIIYYGLQALGTSFTNIRFVGGVNRGAFATNVSSYSGNKTCRAMILTDTTNKDQLELGIYFDDLGLLEYCPESYSSAFNTSYGKAYFNVIRDVPLEMAQGDCSYTRGYYDFRYDN